MEVIREINNFNELYDMCWSGARDTLDNIAEACKQDELMQLLEDIFAPNPLTDTAINDTLWFNSEWVYQQLGLNENGIVEEDI